MTCYKTAIGIDPEYAGNAKELIEAFCPKYNSREIIITSDSTYYVYYWEWEPCGGSEWAEICSELVKHRHALIEIFEEGNIYTDIEVEDSDGIDEEFYELLSWDAEINAFNEPLSRELSTQRLKEILYSYITNDYEASSYEYVLDVLKSVCGCTEEEIEAIGWGELLGEVV